MLEMKCPQLSKPEATAARNETPSVTEWRKNLGESSIDNKDIPTGDRYIFKFLLQTVPTVCVT